MALFLSTFEKIGLLLIRTSCHTDIASKVEPIMIFGKKFLVLLRVVVKSAKRCRCVTFCPRELCSNLPPMWPVNGEKVAQFSPFPQYWPKSSQIIFTWKLHYLKQPKNLPEYLGYFCEKFLLPTRSKIAQSGHTAHTFLILILSSSTRRLHFIHISTLNERLKKVWSLKLQPGSNNVKDKCLKLFWCFLTPIWALS